MPGSIDYIAQTPIKKPQHAAFLILADWLLMAGSQCQTCDCGITVQTDMVSPCGWVGEAAALGTTGFVWTAGIAAQRWL
jgi:hypothetical protein